MPEGGDVAYSWPALPKAKCDSLPGCHANLVEGLLACERVEGGYWWGLGSVYIRVLGTEGGACHYGVAYETEGGYTLFSCSAPLPVHAWSGLDTVEVDGNLQGGGFAKGLDCTQLGLDGGAAPLTYACPPP
jgi:hypothetical protein